ncbi:hypothetical protein L873DRAFT_1840591 [Choiromyces venosus 120613-1]|uniref:Altered inheritance of mitochondria protein 11 n=1 Tax=Choiromyces venosus 120613-1 TaxID=1336337 RepID=A0A3N4K0I1_9PEZI|nr:hypothetical protein L873DRAFT_1840591 [Choiromyces venosus 120613-1]
MAFNPRSWMPWSGSDSSTPPPPPSSSSSSPIPPPSGPSPPPSTLPEPTRLRRQLTLLLGGTTFLALSIALTRRTIHRRKLSLVPKYYHPNNRPPTNPPNGALDALEALNLATLNTLSFGMTLVGGGMFAMDVCSLQELRERVHAGMGGKDAAAREAEEEFEEWLASVLARKERKEEVRRMVEREMKEAREKGEGKSGE